MEANSFWWKKQHMLNLKGLLCAQALLVKWHTIYQLLVDWSFIFLQPFHVPPSRADSYVNEVTLSPAKLHEKLFSMEMWIQSLAEETPSCGLLETGRVNWDKQDCRLVYYLNFLPWALLLAYIMHKTFEQANLWSDSRQLFLGSKGREHGPTFTQSDLQQTWENVQLPFILVSFTISILHPSACVKLN